MDLVLRPFFLGGVMKTTGNKPPMTVASKGFYMQKDLIRNAAYFGIDINLIEVTSCKINIYQLIKNNLYFCF